MTVFERGQLPGFLIGVPAICFKFVFKGVPTELRSVHTVGRYATDY